MTKFQLTVRLGNAAMQEPGDVARAVQPILDFLEGLSEWPQEGGLIQDLNGNLVGSWSLKDRES